MTKQVSINNHKRARNIAFMNDTKAKHNGDCMVLFRCGDFYEAYEDDAEACAKHLGITLRNENGVREVAFPHHALDIYLPKLIRRGYRIAIADDLG